MTFFNFVLGPALRVLPSVVNDLLKEAEQIFKERGDCEQWPLFLSNPFQSLATLF